MRSPTRKSGLVRRDVDRTLFVDKLCERWLVERGATTLYRMAIERLQGIEDLPETFARFRDQEQLHADMLEQLLAELGVHPREQRPRLL